MDWLKEGAIQGLVATATAAVFPVHLDHPVLAVKGLVKLSAVGRSLRWSETEIALIGIFVAGGIKPGIQIRIGNCFFCLMGNDVAMPSAPPPLPAVLFGPVV